VPVSRAGIDLVVSRRDLRLLGPNGAGKTTTMRMLARLSSRSGEAEVAGWNAGQPREVRRASATSQRQYRPGAPARLRYVLRRSRVSIMA